MNANDASGFLTKGSGALNSVTTWMSGVISWLFTFRNMMFMLLIVGILFLAYKLFENDVKRKKYNYNRQREI